MTESETQYIQKIEKELKDLKEQNSSQLSMYEMTTIYLKKLQEELKISEHKLTEVNKKLIDSINYSKHIQDAFIVQDTVLQKMFPSSYIFQKPKDIVSGDFVWAYEHNSVLYLGVGDCTGHGVPGAMLSIFVISMLNQIVNHFENETPAGILVRLDHLMQKYLSQYTDQIRDSVEISLIQYDKHHNQLIYSGAKRPLIHIRDNEITSYKGAKYVLGNSDRRNEQVQDIVIEFQKNDMLFMFSDGFPDQFGGPFNAKFTSKHLISVLAENAHFPIAVQNEKIKSVFDNWRGEIGQTDDVLLVGIQL
ncbi:MAG: Phosphoserine phosphatase RsbU [Bacteroidota bacterium]